MLGCLHRRLRTLADRIAPPAIHLLAARERDNTASALGCAFAAKPWTRPKERRAPGGRSGSVWASRRQGAPRARRKVRTAITRRWCDGVAPMSSLRKMLLTWPSTVLGLRNSRSQTPAL